MMRAQPRTYYCLIHFLKRRKMVKNKNKGKPRNYELDCGVVRFGRSSMYHKKAIYKFVKNKAPKKTAAKTAVFVEKKIKGDKNGGTRMVRVKKLGNCMDYPTVPKPAKKLHQSCFKSHERKLRSSITPGIVAIVLAGVHKGKHVIVLKQLPSGLLLITGPMTLNGCPMRRINQKFIIATKTVVDVSSVKVPESVNDAYFARAKVDNKAKKEGDIFEKKKEEYKPSEQKKKDQAEVDKQVMAAIKKNTDGSMLKQYLRTTFGLSKGQYPHNLVF
jgi:large subunit ribosomal protein L6e